MNVNQTNVEGSEKVYSSYTNNTQAISKKADYGKTVGEPKLSEKAQKYYDELKKKYNNMDFVLVDKDMKDQAKTQAANYANPMKMVVLIDEEKIEKMASDANYRKQYEGIISNATSGLSQMKQSIQTSGAQVKGYGIQVNDGGTLSYFAVLKKSTAAQKTRIEKKQAENKEAKKTKETKEAKEAKKTKEAQEQEENKQTITISASSIEELMKKIEDYNLEDRSNNIETNEEKIVGHQFDYRG